MDEGSAAASWSAVKLGLADEPPKAGKAGHGPRTLDSSPQHLLPSSNLKNGA